MSASTNMVKSGGKRKGPQTAKGIGGVGDFLSSFKTSPRTKLGFRYYRQWEHYHSTKDKRRNPYAEFYLPDDDDVKSSTGIVYHPNLFLTQLCASSHLIVSSGCTAQGHMNIVYCEMPQLQYRNTLITGATRPLQIKCKTRLTLTRQRRTSLTPKH